MYSRLEEWALVYKNPYIAPELQKQCLSGRVFGHLRFEDGTEIVTSPIERLEGDFVITKSGSCYWLGKASKDYEKQFPNAKKRFFESWEKGKNSEKEEQRLPHTLAEAKKAAQSHKRRQEMDAWLLSKYAVIESLKAKIEAMKVCNQFMRTLRTPILYNEECFQEIANQLLSISNQINERYG